MQISNKIKILSPEQAIKIAAGEVVERPVNILKELVENSIDAGANKISIFLEQAGKKNLKIIDNGSGMSSDDAKLCVAQHATSKITSIEDLETIATFGFRGEALASINAVSNLTIITKTDEAQTGTKLRWRFGKLIEEAELAHPKGTTIEVANLFDNIPARQKFLKKDETELRAIITLFQAFCLDYPYIHFQLHHDHKLQVNCPAAKTVKDRISQLFQDHFESKSLELTLFDTKLCSVHGIISSPTYYRYDRNQIFLFVNHRWVKNVDLTKAIMKGYAGTLPPQKYPAAIIFLTINPEQVDVNIHPKKEEVKFLHPKKIENLITQSVKATLENSLHLTDQPNTFTYDFLSPQNITTHSAPTKPDVIIHPHEQKSVNEASTEQQRPSPFSFLNNIKQSFHVQQTPTVLSDQNKEQIEEKLIIPQAALASFQTPQQTTQDTTLPEIQQSYVAPEEELSITLLGQYKTTYILYEKDNNLVFVDQHAAHERILYEQFKKNFTAVATINLLFPEFIKLSAHDIMVIAPYISVLKEHGIHAEIFSDTQLLIQATPVHLKSQSLSETIHQIISWITQLEGTNPERLHHTLHEKIHTKMACSAAIKAGDKLNLEQMYELLKKLHKIEHRFSCPHGRPTFWVLPLDYLEKQFKRDYAQKAEQFYDEL